MNSSLLPNLVLNIPYGSHQLPWDFRVFLYPGVAQLPRREANRRIDSEEYRNVNADRLKVVQALYDVVTGHRVLGRTIEVVRREAEHLRRFFQWLDSAGKVVQPQTMISNFKEWTDTLVAESLNNRASAKKLFQLAEGVAAVVARAFLQSHEVSTVALMRQTRMKRPSTKKAVLGNVNDKQHLQAIFTWGRLLADLCDAFDEKTLSGELPFEVKLSDGTQFVMGSYTRNNELDPAKYPPSKLHRFNSSRGKLPDTNILASGSYRLPLINLRIQAELLIFIAQTGMNLSQAAKLKKGPLRWQTDGEDVLVYKVFKGRRNGVAIFRAFRTYRDFLERYLAWQSAVGLGDDDRLFPLIQHSGKISIETSLPKMTGLRRLSKRLKVDYFGPRCLRKTRVNWLLRRSGDVAIVAQQAAHRQETLLRVYDQPSHQIAVAEINRFYSDSSIATDAPGPGLCQEESGPIPVDEIPPDAPKPDCTSPDGCMFCTRHRDVLTEDYCWRLASHSRLKVLEVSLHRLPNSGRPHPGSVVVDRISAKLRAIAATDEKCARWVRDAEDNVRAGRYHPMWDGHIQLAELIA